MDEINHHIHKAQQIDHKFPCCRIKVKKLSDESVHHLDQQLEIKGTASVDTVITVNCEPHTVNLLDPPSNGFNKHRILPGMFSCYCHMFQLDQNCYLH